MSLWSASFGALPTGNASHKQAAWDRPGIEAIKDELMTTRADPRQKAVLLAAMAPHSGDWLSALPIASCGLRMDDVDLGARYIFEPIAIETFGVFNASARQLLADLGKRIPINTGEATETSYLFQRISVLVQRFNAVLLHDSLPAADCTD